MNSHRLTALPAFTLLLLAVGCENDRSALAPPAIAGAHALSSGPNSITSIDWPNEPAGFAVLTDEIGRASCRERV